MPLLYRDGQFSIDGAPISAEDLTALRDQVVEGWAEDLAAIARAELGIPEQPRAATARQTGFLRRDLPVVQAIEFPLHRIESFGARFLRRVAELVTNAYVFARGGTDRVTDAGWATVADLAARQSEYAEGFVAALRDGQVSEAQAVARARSYSGSAIEAFERGKSALVGFTAPDPGCYPGSGCTRCKSQCRCWLNYDEQDGELLVSWRSEGEGACVDCRALARQWNPLRVPMKHGS